MAGWVVLQATDGSRLVDDIYEAAFLPEFWPRVIAGVGRTVAAPTGALMLFDAQRPVSFSALEPSFEVTQDLIQSSAGSADWHIRYWEKHPFTGFVVAQDYFPAAALAEDRHRQKLQLQGFDSQLGTIIAMPTGEVVVFHVDRMVSDGPFGAPEIARLNALHPHLARASQLSARLGLERAEASLTALGSAGLAAAAVNRAGAVVAVNPAFDAMQSVFRAAAHGRICLAQPSADALLRAALVAAHAEIEPLVRTVPVAATEDTEPLLLHVLPLRGAAHDLFSRASTVLVASPVRASSLVPSASILTGLFDLTPAEARLASALAQGAALADYASASHLAMATLRSHLSRIMAKTGTVRQAQLVALLKSAGSLGAEP